MAKVLLFPQKKKIPKGIQDRLNEVAKEYVEVLQALIVLLDVNLSDEAEYEETLLMVQDAFARGILAAVEEDEED